jgi:hypothetical protein
MEQGEDMEAIMAEFNLENPFPSESQHESNQPSQPARFYLLIFGGLGIY